MLAAASKSSPESTEPGSLHKPDSSQTDAANAMPGDAAGTGSSPSILIASASNSQGAPTAGNDPLADSEDAVWYVRPTSGEQLGPADNMAVRGWLASGIITADSLVWRNGWPEWQRADSIFAQLSPDYTPVGLDALLSEEPIVTTDSSVDHHQVASRPQNTRKIIIVLMTVMTLVLVGALIAVLIINL